MSRSTVLCGEPYVARGIIQVSYVDAAGAEHLINAIQALDARNRHGSRNRLQQDSHGRRAMLWHSATGLLYQPDARFGKAMIVDKRFEYLEGQWNAPQAGDPASRSSHLNIPCTRFPVRQGPLGKLATIGESCVSVELGLTLKPEGKMQVDDKTVIIRTAVTDVRVGEEPEESWFTVPQDSTVIDRPLRKR
ncbi:MAG: hypothetical protein ACUVS7_00820 [Bryobacteraceae bacterium]